jgi:hypothetical protein
VPVAAAKSKAMLRLLLDEHLSPDVAETLRQAGKSVVVFWLAEWDDGRFLGTADAVILLEAARQGLTLVSYDRKTIPPLLKTWAEMGQDHAGVIFVDEKTISPSDIGGLARSLRKLYRQSAQWDWKNRICFLRR